VLVPIVGEGEPYADISVDELNRQNIEAQELAPAYGSHGRAVSVRSSADGAVDVEEDDASIFTENSTVSH